MTGYHRPSYPLERLDDLVKSFQLGGVGRALGDQRRLERVDTVRNGADRGYHRRGFQHIYNGLRRPREHPEPP